MLLAVMRSMLRTPRCTFTASPTLHRATLSLLHPLSLTDQEKYRLKHRRHCSHSSSNAPNDSNVATKNKESSAWKILNRLPSPECIQPTTAANAQGAMFLPEIEALYRGNQKFRDMIAATTPELLRDLAKQGQRPPFMLLDCSDSRVGEQVIFSAEPGTLFTTGNVANQFHEHDLNSKSVLQYAVSTLLVKHVVVMGHYGCGGVAAATLPQPPPATRAEDPVDNVDNAVQDWILPIRAIYGTSERKEIVEHRERRATLNTRTRETGTKEAGEQLPDLHDPAFRALVEENVKANVQRIARSTVISNHYTHSTPQPVYVHGWVYDIETGEVADLGVTVGPPGVEVPASPFPLLR